MAAGLTVLFVRHGESEANHEDRLVSEAFDPALTELGRQQARRLAEHWRLMPVRAVYASPLLRARQTAEPFLAASQLPLNLDARLHEIRLGAFDGRRIAELEAEDAVRYRRWKTDPESPPPGGERLSAVARRMREFLDEVRTRHPDGIVIAVTHADCLKALTLQVLGAPWQSAPSMHFDNVAGLYVVAGPEGVQILGLPTLPPMR